MRLRVRARVRQALRAWQWDTERGTARSRVRAVSPMAAATAAVTAVAVLTALALPASLPAWAGAAPTGTAAVPGRDGTAADPGRDGTAADPGRDGTAADPGRDGTAADPAKASTAADPMGGQCAIGELCLWRRPDFEGTRYAFELVEVGTDSCVPLPKGGTAQSLANRTGRPVTVYQSEECAETGEFETYPGDGDGTWAPQTPYLVRAVKLWER